MEISDLIKMIYVFALKYPKVMGCFTAQQWKMVERAVETNDKIVILKVKEDIKNSISDLLKKHAMTKLF